MRSVKILSIAAAVSFIPTYAQALAPTPVPSPTTSASATNAPSPTPGTSLIKKNARQAARMAYRDALTAAQNGRDLAFADANATMMQSLASAGKDRVARKAAHDMYKQQAEGIIAAYKQAVATAIAAYKAALAAINGK